MTQHIYVKHKSIQECSGPPAMCPICDGGLSLCSVCGLAEGALTTDCPGRDCSDLSDVVYNGAIDYIGGEWVVVASGPSPRSLDEKDAPSDGAAYDDGKWHAATLGHFVGLLVDNDDQAVLFRVAHESEDDERGAYKQTFEVITLPQGQVIDAINEKVPIGVHPVLNALIEGGVVK